MDVSYNKFNADTENEIKNILLLILIYLLLFNKQFDLF